MIAARVLQYAGKEYNCPQVPNRVLVRTTAFPEPCSTVHQMMAEMQCFTPVGDSLQAGSSPDIDAASSEADHEALLQIALPSHCSKPTFILPETVPGHDVAKLIPLEIAERYQCVPVAEEDGVLTVATIHGNEERLTELQRILGRSIYVVLSPGQSLTQALRRMEQFAEQIS